MDTTVCRYGTPQHLRFNGTRELAANQINWLGDTLMRKDEMLPGTITAQEGLAMLPTSAASGQHVASDAELVAVLRELGGFELASEDASQIRALIQELRIEGRVDPEVQPQCDFDPEVDL